MKLNFKKLDPRASTPTYGTEFSAGADLRAVLDAPITIYPQSSAMIRTGLSVAIPEGYVGLIYARSGLACKSGIAPANKVGVIDADYRGEIMVCLFNHGNNSYTISDGDKIAQMVVTPFVHCEYEEADELDETVRGNGGFGSTGKK